MTFQDDLAFGKDGEERVAAKLVQLGFIVSPLYQYEDHKRAPVLFYQLRGAAQTLTHPDLAVFGKTCCFAEVKRKQRWVDFDHERGLETGCDLKLWHQYRLVRRVTGLPVWLFFIHERHEPTGVFIGETEALAAHVREWDGKHGSVRFSAPLAFFPKSALALKWSLAELDDTLYVSLPRLSQVEEQFPARPGGAP